MVKVHDIVRFRDVGDITFHGEVPDWVKVRPASRHHAVVRRMKTTTQTVAIGLRGKGRSERIAGFINKEDIEEIITPQSLVSSPAHYRDSRFHDVLSGIDAIVSPFGYEWGPTGSVGFELATGVPVTTQASDLDMTVYVPSNFDYQVLVQLYEQLQQCPLRIDAQIEFGQMGAALLADIVKFKSGFLLRTSSGPLIAEMVDNQITIRA